MPDNAERLIAIFDEAKSYPLCAEREGFLANACHGDAELRQQIVSLLEAHECAGDFLTNALLPAAAVRTEKPGDKIDRYKLLEKIGEGGTGVVYMADQEEPVRRRVALKVIKLGMDTKLVITRFEAERQALALMDHPNIAKVLDAGATETGRPYFVMELVRGTKITEYCDGHQITTNERLHLFIQVCQAIQHAHQKGIIHRDIKPSNILVTLHDGVAVPKVIDFGIAKATSGQRLTDKTLFTAFEQFVGTPAYMSPEQAEMSGLDIDTRTDIYSLGVLLYELLTGKTPFDGEELLASGIEAMRRTIRDKEPQRPSTRLTLELTAPRPRVAKGSLPIPTAEEVSADERRQLRLTEQLRLVRGDLDWIVMTCLEKDRRRRYETANGLAMDVRRHLDHEPVTARPASVAYRLIKAWQRNTLAYSAAFAIAASMLVATGVSLWQATVATHARNDAQAARMTAQEESVRARAAEALAVEERAITQRNLYIAKMNLARQAWERNHVGRVRQLLEETANDPERGFEWYYWQRQTHLELKTLRGHADLVASISWSPNGQRVVTGSSDKTAIVWDAESGAIVHTLTGHTRSVRSAVFSPDGQRIATASSDATAIVWDAATGDVVLRLNGHGDKLRSIAFSPDGRQIATGSFDGSVRLWDGASGEERVTLEHGGPVWTVAYSTDGRQLVIGGEDETASVWDIDSVHRVTTLKAKDTRLPERGAIPTSTPFVAAIAPDGTSIVTGGRDETATIWDPVTGKAISTLQGPHTWRNPETEELPFTVVYSPDGGRLLTGGLGPTAMVWDLSTKTAMFTLKGHSAEVSAAAYSADGHRIATASYDHTAKIWDADSARDVMALDEHASSRGTVDETTVSSDHSQVIPTAAFASDSRRAVVGSWDGTATVWDVTTGKQLLNVRHGSDQVWGVAFARHDRCIITGGNDGTLNFWDAESGEHLKTLIDKGPAIASLAVSPDDRRILTGGRDRIARVWEVASGALLHSLLEQDSYVDSVAFSPDGQQMLTSSEGPFSGGSAKVWDAASGKELYSLAGHSRGVSCLAYSPDSQRIVTGSYDRTAKVWDAASGKMLFSLNGHFGRVVHVDFSHDGQRIITGGFDNTCKLWHAASGQELLTLNGKIGFRMSPDGRRIVGAGDPPAWVWECASVEQVVAWRKEEMTAQ